MTTLIAHLAAFFAHPLWERIVWTLLHSLWQGALIAVIVALILRRLPALRADARHAVTLAGFAALALALPITFAALTGWNAWMQQQHAAPSTLAQSAPLPPADSSMSPAPGASMPAPPSVAHSPPAPVPSTAAHSGSPNSVAETPQASETFRGWVAWIALFWLLGTTLMLIRTASSLIATRALLRTPALPDHHPLTDTLRTLAARMRLTGPIRLAESDRVSTPCVAGLLRPVILLPITALTNLDESQLRAILAHELAHIRRKDLLVALLQRIIESILFFNPAALWLGRQLRIEREACCDALAAEAIDDPHAVARTLAHVAAASRAPAPFPTAALAMTGPNDAPLLQRIRRLLLPNERIPARLPWPSFLAVTLIACASLFTLTITAAQVGETAAKLLKPEERIEQVRKIARDFGEQFLDNLDAPENLVTIKGRVRTADGSPLPDSLPGRYGHANVFTITGPQSTSGTGYALNIEPDGTFSIQLRSGTTRLVICMRGFAPAESAPIQTKPGETFENFEIVLERGDTGRVQVVDPAGKPIPDVEISNSQLVVNAWCGSAPVVTDQDGIAILENLAPMSVRLAVKHPGYESESIDVSLTEDEPYTWHLTPAKPLVVALYDRSKPTPEGFAPLANARIYFGFDTGSRNSQDPRAGFRPTLLATTDANGVFSIDSLRRDTEYVYWVRWGDNYQMLPRLTLAQSPAEIVVDPPLWINGEVRGDLSKLEVWYDKPSIRFTDNWSIKIDGSMHGSSYTGHAAVDPDTRRVLIGPLVALQRTRIDAGPVTRFINPRDHIDEPLVIDLDQPKPERKVREVVITLMPPRQWPAPQGTMVAGPLLLDGEFLRYERNIADVVEGVARVSVPLSEDGGPGKLYLEPDQLPGYWFERVYDIEIPPGDDPYEYRLPVQPAGSVHGRALMPDGSPASRIFVVLYTVRAPGMPNIKPQVQTTADGRFVLNGIPLNRTFRIGVENASDDEHRVLSEEFRFTEDNLTREINLQFVEGETVGVRILDPNGNHARNANVHLIYETPYSHSHQGFSRSHDAAGITTWNHVNLDLPGEHRIEISPTRDTVGVRRIIDPDNPNFTIQLIRGLRTTGQIIDAATGQPIPNAHLDLFPDFRPEQRPQFPGSVPITTDAEGRFDVRNLEPITYRIQVGDVFPPEAVFNDTDHTITYQGSPSTLTIRAGELDQTIRVAIAPWSSHTPAPAAN